MADAAIAPGGGLRAVPPTDCIDAAKVVPPGARTDEQEIVAVGAVAHVVRRAFHQFYNSDATKHDCAIAIAAEEVQSDTQKPAVATTAAGVAAPSTSTPRKDAPVPAPAVIEDPEQTAELISAVIPESVNPYVLLGESRKAQIQSELRRKRDDAAALLQFLDARHHEAKTADDAIAQQLSDKGLVIKAQIPMGASNLRLEQREVDTFGAFAQSLVHAKQLVSEYQTRRREKSGNGVAQQNRAALGLSAEPVGYLDATNSSNIRTHATLSMHERHIDGVKTHHQQHQQQSVNGSRESDGTSSSATAETQSSDLSATDGGGGGATETGTSQELQTTISSLGKKPHGGDVAMGAVEKRKNLEILGRMQTKLDFLRNPRYVPSESADLNRKPQGVHHDNFTAAPDKLTGMVNAPVVPTPCFVVVPSLVEFTDYDIGGVYEQLVYLRNTSALSRRLRILPPGTLFFSIGEIAFPDPSGLIAPGMHVQLRLRFAPDSRADYKDAIQVIYEGSNAGQREEFTIPLAAHRTPPELSIPLILRAQNTLVGTFSTTRLPCKNTGGKARFWLMTEEHWAKYESSASQFLSVNNEQNASCSSNSGTENRVQLGAFTLSPSEMELDTGESVELLLQYVPSCIGEQRRKFVMVCDNCLVRVFQVVGRGCQVEMNVLAVNHKQIDASVAHMDDVDHLCFSDLLVNARAQQRFVVTNDTPIELAFAWHIEPIAPLSISTSPPPPPPYEIKPEAGMIALNGALEFTVAFLPTQAQVYHYKATLLVNDIPRCSMPGPDQRVQLAQTFQRLSETLNNIVLEAVQCLSLRLDGAGKLGSFVIEPSYWNFSGTNGSSQQQQELKRHATYTTRVKLLNDAPAPVAFEIDLAGVKQRHLKPTITITSCVTQVKSLAAQPPFELAASPMRGEIAPKTHNWVDISFTPHCVGAFSLAVPFSIPVASSSTGVPKPFVRWLLLEGVVAKGEVEILSREVDFGLVLVGASTEATLTFRNPSSVASAEWRFIHFEATVVSGIMSSDARSLLISQTPGFAPPLSAARLKDSQLHRSSSKDSIVSRRSSVGSTSSSGNDTSRSSNFLFTARDTQPKAVVTFIPENGTLAPGETRVIKVLCLAGSLPERLRASFCCQLTPEPQFGGVNRALAPVPAVSARAEIQSPNVFLTPSKLQLGTTYLGVSVRRTFQLVNVSNLEASFKFVEPQGVSKAYSVEFAPKSGTIRSKETVAVTLNYTPRHAGKMTVLLACTVRGLTVPLGIEVSTNQKGLVLSYELLAVPGALSATPQHQHHQLASLLPKSPKEIALERGISIADCDLEPDTNPLSFVPKLLFGDAIPLGERRFVHLLVRNFSGIEAVIDLEAKKFPAKVTSSLASSDNSSTSTTSSPPPQSSQASKSTSNTTGTKPKMGSSITMQTKFRASKPGLPSHSITTSSTRKKLLLNDTHEQSNRFQSENGRDYVRQCTEDLEDREILSRGHGVAFQLQPSHVRIPPWEQAVVTCVCFNNMPGSYADDIVSRANGVPPVFLHAQGTVVGTPLALDRNCVGLFFHKKKPRVTNPSVELTPSFHFGQLCARSPPITRAIRVINRGPKQARLKWKLVESDRENQLVAVSLRVDFDCRVQLCITPCADNDDVTFPFEMHPEQAIVPPFATVPFQITFTPPPSHTETESGMGGQQQQFPRVLLLADAYWYDFVAKDDDLQSGSAELLDPAHSSTGSSLEEHESLTIDSRCETTSPKHKAHTSGTSTAAGKAFAAVRIANSLARRTAPPPGGLVNASASSMSRKCLRVLLGADVIEPELFLDKSIGSELKLPVTGLNGPQPSLHAASPGYHIKFTTWSTVAATDNAHVFHRKELFLVNHFATRLTFRLESVGPFLVFNAVTMAPKHPLSSAELPPAHKRAQGETYMFTLPPQMSVRIDLRFDPSQANTSSSTSLLPGLGHSSLPTLSHHRGLAETFASSSATSSPLARKQQQQHQESQRRLKLEVHGQLLIKFTNRTVQTVNLVTEILRPLVVVSPSTYFFGHVHLSKTRSVVLRVANPTVTPAAFTIQHVPVPVPLSKAQKQEFKLHHAHFVDEPGVFTFSTMKGVVMGPTTSLQSSGGVFLPSTDSTKDLGPNHLVFEPVVIVVVFQAPATRKRFKSRFRFAVAHGLDFEVVLEGEGHLNEQEIADQDRSIVRTSALEHSHQIFKKILR